MNHDKPTIKVLQYMVGDFEYFHWSERINRRYCERHGYEYVISREIPRTDRHVCWHKIPVLINELHSCDYLLLVDADAVFYSHELTIEKELIPLMKDKLLLMAQDVVSESERCTLGLPNTGVILTKNNSKTHEFFEYWNQVSETDESIRWNWPPEQRALWNYVLPQFPDLVHVHPDYYMIHGRYSQYIRHFCLRSDQERVAGIKTICQQLSCFQ